MISWIALVVSLIGCGISVYVYMYGTRIEPLNAEDLFDALLGENDGDEETEYKIDDEPNKEN
jgi:hypothetical protein